MPIASDVDSNNFEKRRSFRDTSDRERTEKRFGKEWEWERERERKNKQPTAGRSAVNVNYNTFKCIRQEKKFRVLFKNVLSNENV